MSPARRDKLAIQTLPSSLHSATQEFEKSALMRETLGDHICDAMLLNKQMEWDQYRTSVSQYEIDKYLPLL
jgi:glutamine synthetase